MYIIQQEKHTKSELLHKKNIENMKVLTHIKKDKSTERVKTKSWYQLPELQNSQVQVLARVKTESWRQLPEQHSNVLLCFEKVQSTERVTIPKWYKLPELENSEESRASVEMIQNEHNYSKEKHRMNFIPEIYSELLELPKIENDQQEVSSAVQALRLLLCEETEESEVSLEAFQDNEISQQHGILSNRASTVSTEQWLCEVCGWVLRSRQALRKHIKTQHLYPSKFSRKRVGIIIPKERSEEKLNNDPTSEFSIPSSSTTNDQISNIIVQQSTSTKQFPRTNNVLPITLNQFSHSFDEILGCIVEVSTTVDDKSSGISLTDMVPDSTTNHDSLVTLYKADSSSGPKKTCFCDVCGKGFVNKYVLTTHKSFHSGIRPFSCQYCCKLFKTKGHVHAHERTHLKEEGNVEAVKEGEKCTTVDTIKKVICDLCGLSFVNKYVLATHKKFHSGIKPYSCRYCEKSFKTKGQMKAHENRHEK